MAPASGGFFVRLCCHLSPPIMIVTVIWQFTNIWNEFLFAVIFSSGTHQPITAALIALSAGGNVGAPIQCRKRRRADRRLAASPGLSLRRPVFSARADAGRPQIARYLWLP